MSPYLITHSRFFWNPHLLIPLSILVLYFGDRYLFKKQIGYLFLAAFFWGFGIACHFSAIFWGLGFIYLLVKTKQIKTIKLYLVIFLGFVLGDLPFFVFELRHNFYNIKTILFVVLNSTSGSEMTSHYFIFPLLVFALFGFLLFINKIKNKRSASLLLAVTFGAMMWLQTNVFASYAPLDVIEGWNYKEQQIVVGFITKNGCPDKFNVVTTVQGDTRAYDLRY